MSDLPGPMTPAECDLRGMPFMPLDIVRLFDSDLYALSTGDEFKAALSLWGKSFLQVPAASLPADERILAHLSGAGPAWKKVRDMAMRGWVKCSDGRYYHPVVAEKAKEAWEARLGRRARTEAARQARQAARGGSDNTPPDRPTKNVTNGAAHDATMTATNSVTEDVTGSKGQYKGQGQGQLSKKEAKPAQSDSGPPARDAVPLMPSLSDGHHRWAHLGEKDEIDPDGKRHPVVAGWYLDDVCRFVCEAAGINDASFRGDWRPIIAWLKDGLDPHEHILPAIRQVAARAAYRPSEVRSFAYFDAAVRQYRGAA